MTVEKLQELLAIGGQVLKTRDDDALVPLNRKNNDQSDNKDQSEPARFMLPTGSTCSWAKANEDFGPEKLRPRIEPWLTALVQSEHLCLLIGSGLTHAVLGLAKNNDLPVMSPVTFRIKSNEITQEARRVAQAAGRENGNIEDQIRVATELLRGLEIIAVATKEKSPERQSVVTLKEDVKNTLQSFASIILTAESKLVTADTECREKAFNYLVSFLMSFASRAGTRERLQLFTTNYDRFIEAGADVAGLRLIDRFVGTLAPIFRASRLDVDLHYNPPGIRGEPRYLEGVARFTKLHGSVDWLDCNASIKRIGLPFGAMDTDCYLNAPGLSSGDATRLMIYPNAAKDRETTAYPYVELFRDLAASICRPNSTVVCYGYSFGDEHINRVIEDMLTIPSTHLVIIAHSDPLNRILRTYERLGRQAQITLLIGDHLGDLRALVDHYLPKSAIDRTTFRMAELLKARWGTEPHATSDAEDPPAFDGGSS